MKKFFSFFLVSLLISSLTLPVIAADHSTIQLEPFNEYDYIERLQGSTLAELAEIGVSQQEAISIVAEFESALLNRASLSDSELQTFGYNDYEITLFRKLANGQKLSPAELRSLGATCNGSIERGDEFTAKTAEFSYTFTWERCPIITLWDSAAMRWVAYASDGDEIGVSRVSYSMDIEYHFTGGPSGNGGPAFAHRGTGTNEPNLDFNTLNMQFPVYQTHASPVNGIIFDCYARTGTVKVLVKVPDGVSQSIHHIHVAGLYGHTLIGIGSPSVSIGADSLGISFTGHTSTDPIAERKATIYRTSTDVEYWDEG